MNHRIIDLKEKFPNVLLYRDRRENGDDIVIIQAIGTVDNVADCFAEEVANFGDNHIMAQSFIRDFSEKSAIEFCERNEIGC